MIKTRWVRRALVVGATVSTLGIGCLVLQDTSDASALCQEAELAGISLSMDKYYTATYTAAAEEEKEPEVTETPAPTEVPAATPTEAPVAKEPSKYENVGISIANDYVNIRKRASENSKILGKLYRGAAATIEGTKGDWVKISSGSVNGFIKKEYLAIGEEAEKVAEKFGKKIATVNTTTLKVRQKKSTESLVVTLIPDEESYNVVNEYDKWVKIKVDGDTKGYVAKEYVDISIEFKDAISIKEEKEIARRKAEAEAAAAEAAAYEQAQQQAYSEPAQQDYQQSDSGSSDSGSSNSGSSNGGSSSGGSSSGSAYKNQGTGTGSDVAAYAQKFVGNPYVYGGTSLTKGADCSGFVMSVYARFGYSLPRVAASQAGSGTKVSLDSVQPGDLIFYGGSSGINHVAMYVGNGTVVHASNETDGIKYSDMFYRTPTCARRIIND